MRHTNWVRARSILLIGGTLWLTACPPETEVPVVGDLPEIGLSQYQVVSLDLDDYISDTDNADEELAVSVVGSDVNKVQATVDPVTHVLTLTAAGNFSGRYGVDILATDPAGNQGTALLNLNVHANRSCTTLFSYDSRAYGGVSSLNVAGNFNNWSASAHPMQDPDGDGVYTSEPIALNPGYHQYKLVSGGATWFLDPGNPFRAWEGGFENSELKVEDCSTPLLTLEHLSIVRETGTVEADILFTDGTAGSGPAPDSLRVTVAGEDISPAFNDYQRTFEIRLSGLAPGKHTLRIDAASNNGFDARQLFVPIWIDELAFDWKAASLYFAFTDRFSDGSPSNNSPVNGVATAANYQGGDFAGLTARIEDGYLESMGINTLWITPQIDNTNNAEYGDDGRLYSAYHGYWPTNSLVPESRLGSDSELKALVEAAHDRGIRVLFDLVANHVHNQHLFYAQHKNDGWFNTYALCKDNDGWNSNPIGCWFAPYLPDLNYKNAEAQHVALDDLMRMLMEYDVDGFRVDAVKHVETSFIRNLVGRIEGEVEHRSVDPAQQFYLVGETFVGEWSWSCSNTASCAQWLTKQYIGPGLLDGQFDFPLYWQALKTFARGESDADTLNAVLEATEDYYGPDAVMSYFIGNHDVPRFISHANGDIADQWGNGSKEQGWTNPPASPSSDVPHRKLRAAMTFLAGLPGVPLIYYGDDIGMPGAGDPDNRRSMRFGGSLSTLEADTLAAIQRLFSARASHPALREGNRTTLQESDPAVLVYARKSGNSLAIVATNASGASRNVTVSVSAIGVTSGTLVDVLTDGSISVSGGNVSFTLPAYGSALYIN